MGRKKKSLLKRIGITLIILLTAYIVLYFITPSVPSYYYEKENDKVLAGLEIPLLEDGETLILHTGYSLVYDEQTEQARWVAYHLTQDELYGLYDRKDNFRSDPLITTGSAQLEDYRKSGYDRGHLIPAADASWSESAMSETFFMSNMSPQEPKFNRGIWADLEAVVRNFAATNQEVYVVTGPIYDLYTPPLTIGPNNVAVPDAYFKVVLDYKEPELKAIAFILKNEGSNSPLHSFAVSVDAVEELTSIDFFPLLEDTIEETLESSFDIDLWDVNRFSASKEERRSYLSNKEEGIEEEITPPESNNPLYTLLLDVMMESKKEIQYLIKSYIKM